MASSLDYVFELNLSPFFLVTITMYESGKKRDNSFYKAHNSLTLFIIIFWTTKPLKQCKFPMKSNK